VKIASWILKPTIVLPKMILSSKSRFNLWRRPEGDGKKGSRNMRYTEEMPEKM